MKLYLLALLSLSFASFAGIQNQNDDPRFAKNGCELEKKYEVCTMQYDPHGCTVKDSRGKQFTAVGSNKCVALGRIYKQLCKEEALFINEEIACSPAVEETAAD